MLGIFNTIVPIGTIVNGTEGTLAAISAGDYRAAGKTGIQTLLIAVATAITLGEGAAALAGGKGAGTAAIGNAENAALKNAAKEGANLNTNTATSKFGVYEIEVNGSLYKIGKADCNRVTQSSGLPTRLHQQLVKLERAFGEENVAGRVVDPLGETTTAQAKLAETAHIRAHFEQTGTVPPGNQKSFKP